MATMVQPGAFATESSPGGNKTPAAPNRRKRPATEKRRQQNRDANRVYRERQKKRLQELERLTDQTQSGAQNDEVSVPPPSTTTACAPGMRAEVGPENVSNNANFGDIAWLDDLQSSYRPADLLHDLSGAPLFPDGQLPSSIDGPFDPSILDPSGDFAFGSTFGLTEKSAPCVDYAQMGDNFLPMTDAYGPFETPSDVSSLSTGGSGPSQIPPSTSANPNTIAVVRDSFQKLGSTSSHETDSDDNRRSASDGTQSSGARDQRMSSPSQEALIGPFRQLLQLEDTEENNSLVKIAVERKLTLKDIVLSGLKTLDIPEPSASAAALSPAYLPDPQADKLEASRVSTIEAFLHNARALGVSPAALYRTESQSPFHRPGYTSTDDITDVLAEIAEKIDLPHLKPTPTQILLPHHPYLDVLPFPIFRSRAIYLASRTPQLLRTTELKYDIIDLGMICHRSGREVSGQPGDRRSWEVANWFQRKWWMLFDAKEWPRENEWSKALIEERKASTVGSEA